MDPFYNSDIDDIYFRTVYGDFLDLLSTQQGLSPEAANMLYIVVRCWEEPKFHALLELCIFRGYSGWDKASSYGQKAMHYEQVYCIKFAFQQYPYIGEFLKDGWRANAMETMLNRLGDRMDQRITESFTELRQLGDIPIDLSPEQMNIAKTFVKEFLVEIHRNQLNVADDVIAELRNNPQFQNIFGNATQERKLLNYVKSYATEQRHLFRKHRSIAREIEERKSDNGGRKPKEPHWWEMVSDLLQRAEKENELGNDRRSSRWSNFIKSITDKESMATSLSLPSPHPQSSLFSHQTSAYTSYSAISSVAGPSNLPHMAFNASFGTEGSLQAAPNHWTPWSYH
ncbi:hypothetical protein M422DRAFT_246138 [Sphaerobolus stellatus SS14]|nr:hypothetical protein M422DRAFT_246138 [Sphaerobolus stellatus SS14]